MRTGCGRGFRELVGRTCLVSGALGLAALVIGAPGAWRRAPDLPRRSGAAARPPGGRTVLTMRTRSRSGAVARQESGSSRGKPPALRAWAGSWRASRRALGTGPSPLCVAAAGAIAAAPIAAAPSRRLEASMRRQQACGRPPTAPAHRLGHRPRWRQPDAGVGGSDGPG